MSDLREAAQALLEAYERYRATDDIDTLDDAAIALRAALAADADRVSEWQPIETAPKTSRAILVHCSERKNDYIVSYGKVGGFLQANGWRHFGGNGDLMEAPTHWMPLPAPPALATAEKEPRNGS